MRSTSAVLARLCAVVIAVAAISSVAQRVQAHTDFNYSVPTDGASVGTPLSEVTVAFTLPVTLVGSGFEVLDPQGNVLQPFAVTDDDTIFKLQFDPPLAGGVVGVRYTVAAEDGHTLSGSFSFTVSVPLPTSTTTIQTTTTTLPTSQPTTTLGAVASSAGATTSLVGSDPTTSGQGATESTISSGGGNDDQTNSGLLIGIAAGIAVGAALFLAYRARTA